ncbi:MAG TPA: DUF6779 domain-containing protein [Mycobacterium sp.]
MTSPRPRGGAARRGGRRPGWTLLTTLLVLAIVASAALVFTSRVELLKLAVIVALWAAVVAAFVSVTYRRQSDADRARVRDLKLVYDLQLDREISARREYELSVETHLRRELASELRTQAADEVAALRSELAALRNNLEILFDTGLGDRPALENERTTVRAYSDWARTDSGPAPRVTHDPLMTGQEPHLGEVGGRTAEHAIIDVPEVGVPAPEVPAPPTWQPAAETQHGYPEPQHGYAETYHGYAETQHSPPGQRLEYGAGPAREGGRRSTPERPRQYPTPRRHPEPEPAVAQSGPIPRAGWTPEPGETAARREPVAFSESSPSSQPPPRPPRGRHASAPEPAAGPSGEIGTPRHYRDGEQPARARHSVEPGRHGTETASARDSAETQLARHRSAEQASTTNGLPAGGQSVAELLARMQAAPIGGRRRRRREDQEAQEGL